MLLPNVSITTITQLQRNNCINILLNIIKKQNYKNIVQWIIIEGSNSFNDAKENEKYILNIIDNNNHINIKYIPFSNETNLDNLKQFVNDHIIGDINVYMDDDDYYFPSYVNHCVDKLLKSNKMVAGSDTIYVHDIIINKTYKMTVGINIHAYKKGYNFNFDPNNIEPLSCDYLMVKIIHNNNTNFNKILTLGGCMVDLKGVVKLEDQIITIFIPEIFYNEYKKIFYIEGDLDYDIVYFSGGFGIVWDPSDKKLGGSEQAIVNLSENWAKLNKKVVVYGNFKEDIIYNNVDYKLWTKFPFEKKIKNLIAWRRHGIVPLMNIDFKANRLFLDFHDNFSYTIADLNPKQLMDLFTKAYKINIKSEYHKTCFKEFLRDYIKTNQDFLDDKYNVILNGVRVNDFSNNTILNDNKPIIRNPYRFCYCSSYDRGLESILKKIWPIIYSAEPRAELHVYYGMDYIFDDNFKNHMKLLLSQPGVMDHGRQPMEMIIREKYLSTFHIYINDSIAEIDCISIRESLVTGCIPIISNFGVFKERHGMQFDWDPNNDKLCNYIANDIINKMKDENYIKNASKVLTTSNTIIGWDEIAKKWLTNFQ